MPQTLSDYIASTMGPHHFSRLAPRTRSFYGELNAAHIAGSLGDVEIGTITPRLLREWQTARLDAGAGPANLNRALSLVGMTLAVAVEDELIQSNPVAKVRKVTPALQPAFRPIAPSAIEKIRVQLDERDRFIVSLLAYAGVRPGELYALRWDDLGDRAIRITQAVDGTGGLKRTKTRAGRLVRLLEPLRHEVELYLEAHSARESNGLVFPGVGGQPMTTAAMGNWRRRIWTAALSRADVPYQRPYDLRHSYASLLLAAGHTIHYVAAQLGHSPKLTLSTYGHVIAEYEGLSAVDITAEILEARGESPLSAPGTGRSGSGTRRSPLFGRDFGIDRPWSLFVKRDARPKRAESFRCWPESQ